MKRATIFIALLCLVMVVGLVSTGCNGGSSSETLYSYTYPGGTAIKYPYPTRYSVVEDDFVSVEKWNSAEHQAALKKANVAAPK